MSAYMVSDDTINKVVSFLVYAAIAHKGVARYLENEGYPLVTPEQQETLANKMFDLNIQGVNARYGDGEAEKFRPLDFKYRLLMPCSPIHVHKALACLLYQCSEGDIDETPLYKTLTQVNYLIAESIVHNLPAYELAPWG